MANNTALDKHIALFFMDNPIAGFLEAAEPCAVAYELFSKTHECNYRKFERTFNLIKDVHDEHENKPRTIGSFFIRSSNQHGRVKIYVHVLSDGRHVQHSLMLNDGTHDMHGCEKLCTKFGMTLYSRTIAYKYDTMVAIAKGVSQVLRYNDIKREDILR